jgi:DNA-directed RNA polymerase subunit RPC12/RpoP
MSINTIYECDSCHRKFSKWEGEVQIIHIQEATKSNEIVLCYQCSRVDTRSPMAAIESLCKNDDES